MCMDIGRETCALIETRRAWEGQSALSTPLVRYRYILYVPRSHGTARSAVHDTLPLPEPDPLNTKRRPWRKRIWGTSTD